MAYSELDVSDAPPRRPLGSARQIWIPILVVALVIAAGAVFVNLTREHHAGGDPGGHIMATLKSAKAAIPANADVAYSRSAGPKWDSCDAKPGSYGWDNLSTDVSFKSSDTPERVLAHANEVLSADGWTAQTLAEPYAGGLNSRWTKPIPTSGSTATVMLSNNNPDKSWSLIGNAAPVGQRVDGC